jgi:amino acid adenylation domain-containing protein
MRPVWEFIAFLRDQGIALRPMGKRIHWEAPKGAMTAERRSAIAERKDEILAYLTEIGGPAFSIEPIPLVPRDDPLPLSFAQRRLWFLDRLAEGATAAYNVPGAITLRGILNRPALENALCEILRRHEALRTVFQETDHGPVQVILDPPTFSFPVVDLTTCSQAEQRSTLTHMLTEAAHEPFDLAKGPLLRARLYRLEADEHLLFFNMHHIISDGWSLGVLFRELGLLYTASAVDGQPSLPALPIQYADYAVWQRSWLRGDVLQHQLEYWKQQLAGAPPELALPTDRSRPAVRGHRGGHVRLTIPKVVVAGLRQIGQRAGTTLFMSLLAAFAVLLSRWSGQEDIVIGTPIAGRRHPALEPLIGFFVNMLALRANLSGNPSFLELLSRVRCVTLDAYCHQDLPFEHLVEELQPDRSLSHTPIFQVVLTLQNAPVKGTELAGLETAPADLSFETSKFDLTLILWEVNARLYGTLEYNTDLFDELTIRRMADHFQTLLKAIATDPQSPILDLPMLTMAERHRILAEWNSPRIEPSADNCVHRLFEAQAGLTPDAVAVVFEGRSLTYRALNERANQLSHYLCALGVEPEKLVGICVERSIDMIVGILGILKAGGAYVPLDPEYPDEHLAFIVEDAALDILLVHRLTAAKLTTMSLRRVQLDPSELTFAGESMQNPRSDCAPENPAYVIYTSGSTGRPKGVVVEHRTVSQLFRAAAEYFDFSATDVWTLFHSYTFDFSVWEIWGALLHGGRLICVPFAVSRSPDLFHRLLKDESVTVLNQTPSAFYGLIDEVLADTCDLALRYIVFGGEVLEPRRLRHWFNRFGEQRPVLVNMYGTTETTVHVTFRQLTVLDCDAGIDDIGRTLSHLTAYICNARMGLQPVGVPGELYIGGGGLARAYLKRPDLTAARFVADPFAGQRGARLYRTGDLARWLPNGRLQYLGRVDRQVKLRGFRIELGEIEARLVTHPGIRNAAVILREDQSGERRLVAYLVPPELPVPRAESAQRLIVDVEARLRATLPSQMIPSSFVMLESLPLTLNGKLDAKSLPAPATASWQLGHVAPRSELEWRLCEIWQSILHLDKVGVTESFFSIGGDSILSLKVVGEARKIGMALGVKDLFQAPTIRELARLLQDRARIDEKPMAGPFSLCTDAERARFGPEVEDAYPLASLQAGMIFHSQLDEAGAHYHDVFGVHLRAPWNPTCFRQALAHVIATNATLRTGFKLDGERPLQFVRAQVDAPLVFDDLSGLTEQQQERWLDNWMAVERLRGFRWTEEPLFRVFVRRRTEESFEYGLSMHHALLDGWSVATFNVQLLTTYRCLLAGEDPPPVAAPPPYRDFVALEQAALSSREDKEWWCRTLGEAPTTTLPRRQARQPEPKGPTTRLQWDCVTNISYPRLAEAAKRLEAPLKNILLAAHMKVLAGLSGQDEVISCVVFNGRPDRAGSEQTLGLFLNSLPLRVKLDGGTWRELVGEIGKTMAAISQHRLYPLASIQRDIGQSVSEVLFNFTHFHVYREFEAGREFEFLKERHFERTNFPLTVNFSRSAWGDGLSLSVSCDATLLDEDLANRIPEYYSRALTAIVENDQASHRDFSILGAAERRQVLEEWNATARAYPEGQCIHELFEAQARHRPEAVAVEFEGVRLSYGDLERRANHLAHHLRRRGVGPETLVGVCFERSIEMVVGLLGVLKAGGAYLPLDPEYPDQRLAFMIEGAQVALVLVHAATRDRLMGGAERLCLDADRVVLDREPDHAPDSGAGLRTLAYVLYTSGSTGEPKGVAVEHRNVVRLVCGTDYVDLGPETVLLQLAPLVFDPSTFEIWGALLHGGRLVVARPGRLSLEELATLLVRDGVNTLWLTAGLFHLMVDRHLAALRGLRQLLAGGDVLSPEHVRRALDGLVGLRLINGYGLTEATTFSCCYRVPKVGWGGGAVPIGRPIANTRVYVLDGHLCPVPIGVVGELYVGGAGVARGYLNRPELTAERFLADPFSSEPDARLYRSGDLCRWRGDGTLEFVGRRDEQVKIRGFRIESGEIEAALARHPAVSEAAVLAREGGGGERRLVAYVVAAPEAAADAGLRDLLRTHLRQSLPEHMIPAQIAFLGELPLTTNGKLDRRALPELEGSVTPTNYAAPLDEVELRMTAIWERLLGVGPIGRFDDFFDLGGHSLLALRLVGSIHETFGAALSLATLIEARSIAALADRLRRVTEPPNFSFIINIQPRGESSPLFCIHPGGGTSFCYASLASYLGRKQPLYGLQAIGLDGLQAPLTSVEEMAATYISEMRRVQPHGPYRICGWSFGGIVAFEMARQLFEHENEISPLFLIDSRAPALFSPEQLDFVTFTRAMLKAWRAPLPEELLEELDRANPAQQVTHFVEATRDMRNCHLGFDPVQMSGLWRVYAANILAGAHYRPSRWPAVIRLLQASSGDPLASGPPGLGWAPLVASVETREVPGPHERLLNNPYVGVVAAHLKDWLQDVDTLVAGAFRPPTAGECNGGVKDTVRLGSAVSHPFT